MDPTDAQAIEAGLDNLCDDCGTRHGEGECPMFVEVEDAPYNDRERILAAQADAEYQRANGAEEEVERLRAGIQEVLDSGSIQRLRERAEQAESALASLRAENLRLQDQLISGPLTERNIELADALASEREQKAALQGAISRFVAWYDVLADRAHPPLQAQAEWLRTALDTTIKGTK